MSYQDQPGFDWQQDTQEMSCFDACYEAESTLEHYSSCLQGAYQQQECHQPAKNCYKVILEGRYIFLETKEQLIGHLSATIQHFLPKQSHPDYKSVFALYHYSPQSFIYLLAENCTEILKQERHQNWLTDQVIEIGLMMMEGQRFLSNEGKLRSGSRKLMKR